MQWRKKALENWTFSKKEWKSNRNIKDLKNLCPCAPFLMKLPKVLPKWRTKSRERHQILPLKQRKKEGEGGGRWRRGKKERKRKKEEEEEGEKGTRPNHGFLKAKQADQSAHPELTAQSGTYNRNTQPSVCTRISRTFNDLDSLEYSLRFWVYNKVGADAAGLQITHWSSKLIEQDSHMAVHQPLL